MGVSLISFDNSHPSYFEKKNIGKGPGVEVYRVCVYYLGQVRWGFLGNG